MPDTVALTDNPSTDQNTRNNAPLFASFGNQKLNSTITVTFEMEEVQPPQTGLIAHAWTVAPPIENPSTNIRSEYFFKSAVLAALRSENTSNSAPPIQGIPFVPIYGLPTRVLPSAIASNWNDLAAGGLSERIYQRLLELALLTAGWNGSGSLGMNASSLGSFVAVWKQIRPFSVEPELVLTPSGHLQAEWSKSRKHHLDIDFRASEENSYFALIDGDRAVIEGAASLKEILRIITSYRDGVALTWQYEQEK